MRIAVPISGGRVSAHFGHCEQFGLFDTENGEIKSMEYVNSPPHEPGAFPRWLKERGADIIISGGMGRRAQELFSREGIEVILGTDETDPERLVRIYLDGELESGDNPCDH
jgi:predicted Fe-Mo cluster-binding NifX family protein